MSQRKYTPPITFDNGGIELDTTPDSDGDLELVTTLEGMHVGYLRPADQIALRDFMNRLHPTEPKQITTAEELDALPEGTVIRDDDHDICRKAVDGLWWSMDQPLDPFLTETMAEFLPATVLHEPEATA